MSSPVPGAIATLIEWDNDIPDWPTLARGGGRGARYSCRRRARVGGVRGRPWRQRSKPRSPDALLDAAAPVPDAVTAADAPTATRRFAVYRNNVVAGLANTLRSRFPATEKIVGEEFFAAMARVFVTEKPPRSPLLAAYGDEFPAFVAAFAPARELPYLADVARLEAARTRAYHAEDAVPVDAGAFAALDPGAAGGLRIALHPSTEIVRSPPSHRHHLGDEFRVNGRSPRSRTGAARMRWSSARISTSRSRLLPPGGAAFLLALAAGRTLADAAETARADHSAFDLAGNLAGLIGWGVAGKVILPAPHETG